MTDRELIEAAAKAAGIVTHGCYVMPAPEIGAYAVWNPLDDDGDAFRLAVQLGMDIMHRRSDPEVWAQVSMMPTICEPAGEDRYAATRRAIVRAAAALGARYDAGCCGDAG